MYNKKTAEILGPTRGGRNFEVVIKWGSTVYIYISEFHSIDIINTIVTLLISDSFN